MTANVEVKVSREVIEDIADAIYEILHKAGIPVSHTFDINKLFEISQGKLSIVEEFSTGMLLFRWQP